MDLTAMTTIKSSFGLPPTMNSRSLSELPTYTLEISSRICDSLSLKLGYVNSPKAYFPKASLPSLDTVVSFRLCLFYFSTRTKTQERAVPTFLSHLRQRGRG